MTMSFLRADGTPEPADSRWSHWLPARRQVQAAVQLDFTGDVGELTMRQGLGLVVLTALLAGLLPFISTWIAATRAGVVAPLVGVVQDAAAVSGPGPWTGIWEMVQTLAGLPPAVLPGWMAALLSALGGWLNWPLNWLAWWIVYGVGVLACAKAFGAGATLQRFYRLTSYAAAPLVLVGLAPIPYLGFLASIVGVVWMLLVYTAGVRAATGVSLGQTLIAIILPAAAVALLSLLLLISLLATIVQML